MLKQLGASLLLALLLTPSSLMANCYIGGTNERLENYCLIHAINGSEISISTARQFDIRMRREGYQSDLGLNYAAPKSTFGAAIYPTLKYSNNLNGGNPPTDLVLGSFAFQGDPNYYLKTGLIGGATLGLGGRYIYGEGRYLNYNINGGYAKNPQHDLEVMSKDFNLCSFNHIVDWWNLDACLSGSSVQKELSQQKTTSMSISMSKIFNGKLDRYHQVGMSINRLYMNDYTQDQLKLSVDTIYSNNFTSKAEIGFGEAVTNQLATRLSIATRVAIRVAGDPVILNADYSEASGGKLLGYDRSEQRFSLSASRPVSHYFNLTIGYQVIDSNIDYFDARYPSIGIELTPISF